MSLGNIVLYFIAAEESAWLPYLTRCLQCGLEFFLAFSKGAEIHVFGGIVTALTLLVPMIIGILRYFLRPVETKDAKGNKITMTFASLLVSVLIGIAYGLGAFGVIIDAFK